MLRNTILDQEDLVEINTGGFRGEAPSFLIAATASRKQKQEQENKHLQPVCVCSHYLPAVYWCCLPSSLLSSNDY